jgi:hypothetical protein
MTTRRWMIIAVILGLILAGYDLKRRHDRFLTLARTHAVMGQAWLRPSARRQSTTHATLMVHHHANLEAKYLLAARYPWFRVAPDPPPPRP